MISNRVYIQQTWSEHWLHIQSPFAAACKSVEHILTLLQIQLQVIDKLRHLEFGRNEKLYSDGLIEQLIEKRVLM